MTKILLILTISFASLSCRVNPPRVDVTFYAGDSSRDGVYLKEKDELIKCSEPKFDDMVCLSYADLKEIYEKLILNCKMWDKNVNPMSMQEALRMNMIIEGLK